MGDGIMGTFTFKRYVSLYISHVSAPVTSV